MTEFYRFVVLPDGVVKFAHDGHALTVTEVPLAKTPVEVAAELRGKGRPTVHGVKR